MIRKTHTPRWTWLLMLALLSVALVACSSTQPANAALTTEASESGAVTLAAPTTEEAIADTAPATTSTAADLSPEEIEGLLYMREEEKLARDVYLNLYEQWGLQVFQNIARSEQQHMDAVLSLLQQYGLEDPAAGQGVGEFTNPDLQQLYDQLVAQGQQSVAEALKVGAAIEEIDILDLQERLAQTDEVAIQQVYRNLMSGSENHLRAFTSTLEQQTGETYEPQYLSPEEYQRIIAEGAAPGARGGSPANRGRWAGRGWNP